MKRQRSSQNLFWYLSLGIGTLAVLIIGLVLFNGVTTTRPKAGQSINANVAVSLHSDKEKKKEVDVQITKSVSNPTPCQGEQITYLITATNLSNKEKAKKLKIEDVLPGELSFVSATASKGKYEQDKGEWELNKLKKQENETLSIAALVMGQGSITNTATYKESDNPDPNPANDTASADIVIDTSCGNPPPPPTSDDVDLSLEGFGEKPEVKHGDNTKLTFKIKNKSKKTASNIIVKGNFHRDLLILQAIPTKGVFNQQNSEWDIPDLAEKEEQILQLTTKLKADAGDTELPNEMDIISADQTDPNVTDNQAQVVLAVKSASALPSAKDQLPATTGTTDQTYPASQNTTQNSSAGSSNSSSDVSSSSVSAWPAFMENSGSAPRSDDVEIIDVGLSQKRSGSRPNVLRRAPTVIVKVQCPGCVLLSFAALLVLIIVAALTVTSCLVHASYLRPASGNRLDKPRRAKPRSRPKQ